MTATPHTTSAAPMPEALRLAAWLNEGAWHKMTLGDVVAAGQELRRLHALAASAPVAPTQPTNSVVGEVGWHMIQVEKLLCRKLKVNWSPGMSVELLVDMLAAAPKADRFAGVSNMIEDRISEAKTALDGFVLAPVEPTDKMVQAAHHLDLSYMPGQEGADRAAVYRAMLAAAPKVAPASQPSNPAKEQLLEWERKGELVERVWGTLKEQEREIMRLEKELAAVPKTDHISDAEQAAWHAGIDAGRSIAQDAPSAQQEGGEPA